MLQKHMWSHACPHRISSQADVGSIPYPVQQGLKGRSGQARLHLKGCQVSSQGVHRKYWHANECMFQMEGFAQLRESHRILEDCTIQLLLCLPGLQVRANQRANRGTWPVCEHSTLFASKCWFNFSETRNFQFYFIVLCSHFQAKLLKEMLIWVNAPSVDGQEVL